MMRDYDRLASLFTPDGAARIPHIGAEAVGREQIRAGIERLQARYLDTTPLAGSAPLAAGAAANPPTGNKPPANGRR